MTGDATIPFALVVLVKHVAPKGLARGEAGRQIGQ